MVNATAGMADFPFSAKWPYVNLSYVRLAPPILFRVGFPIDHLANGGASSDCVGTSCGPLENFRFASSFPAGVGGGVSAALPCLASPLSPDLLRGDIAV